MLRARTEHPFRGLNSQHQTAIHLLGSCLPAKRIAQSFLKAAATFSAASQQLSLWLVGVPKILKRFITRLAVVLVVTLCPALIAQADVNVDNDLISFARWKDRGDGYQSLDPLYTLTQTGGIKCVPFEIGKTTKTLSLETQLTTRNCQIGEGTGTGNKGDWDQMLKLTWKTKEACEANTQLLFGGPLTDDSRDGVIEVDYHSQNIDCNESPHTRNFALPALSRAQVFDGKIKVSLGMDAYGQDKVIGYWTITLPTPECSDVTDWAAAATEEGWSCTINDQPYEYADFHILITDGTEVCAAPDTYLPTEDNNNQGLFCAQEGNTVRAIYDWKNNNRNKELNWLEAVVQIGSRTGACDKTPTVGGRCPNQIVTGREAFKNLAGEGGAGIANLDTSNLTNMYLMFFKASAFNQNIGRWDTSKVTNMREMLSGATAFNQNIGGWDTSKVTGAGMISMFSKASAFNQHIGGWDTSKVTSMTSMFSGASAFNQDISNWNTENVENMSSMFSGASAFTQDIGGWDTSKVTNMSSMFRNASAFNGDISRWNTENVENMSSMFYGASVFDQDIGKWSTEKVASMSYMFYRASAFDRDIGGWNTEKVASMASMFYGASAFAQDIGGWKTSGVTDMSYMFRDASAFDRDIGGWNTEKVTTMSGMFRGASAFNRDISVWNIESVKNVSSMFENAVAFDQDIGNWNTENVENMSSMFSLASAFNRDIGGWNTEKVTNMRDMFSRASAFNQDLSGWNVAGIDSEPQNFRAYATSWTGIDQNGQQWCNKG